MLRILEHGYRVYGVIEDHPTVEVDMPQHIANVEGTIESDAVQKALYEEILKS
jgi:CMP-2-keto-3-deoxyoctulosonic acid synthetase